MSQAGIGNDFVRNLLGGFGIPFGQPGISQSQQQQQQQQQQQIQQRQQIQSIRQRPRFGPNSADAARQDFMGARDFAGQLAQGESTFGAGFGLNNLGMQAQQRQQMMQMMAQRFNNPATRLVNRMRPGRPGAQSPTSRFDQLQGAAANAGLSVQDFMSQQRQGQPQMLGNRRGPGMLGLVGSSEAPGFESFPGGQDIQQQQINPLLQFLQTQASNQQNQQQQFMQSPLGQSITNNAAGQGGRFFKGRRIG